MATPVAYSSVAEIRKSLKEDPDRKYRGYLHESPMENFKVDMSVRIDGGTLETDEKWEFAMFHSPIMVEELGKEIFRNRSEGERSVGTSYYVDEVESSNSRLVDDSRDSNFEEVVLSFMKDRSNSLDMYMTPEEISGMLASIIVKVGISTIIERVPFDLSDGGYEEEDDIFRCYNTMLGHIDHFESVVRGSDNLDYWNGRSESCSVRVSDVTDRLGISQKRYYELRDELISKASSIFGDGISLNSF